MPPASRNHLAPTGGDTPACAAASSLERPAAIADQNTRRCSRRATGGRPGERSAFRPDLAERRFPVVIATSFIRVLRRPIESALDAAVAVVDEAGAAHRLPGMQRLLQGIEDEARFRAPRHPPADDAPGIGVDDEGDVDEARPGGDVGEVGDPEPVRRRNPELAVHPVERTGSRLVADRGSHGFSSNNPLQTHLAHQAGDRASRNRDPFAAELAPDLAHAVDPEVLLPDPPDMAAKQGVAAGAGDAFDGSARRAACAW